MQATFGELPGNRILCCYFYAGAGVGITNGACCFSSMKKAAYPRSSSVCLAHDWFLTVPFLKQNRRSQSLWSFNSLAECKSDTCENNALNTPAHVPVGRPWASDPPLCGLLSVKGTGFALDVG